MKCGETIHATPSIVIHCERDDAHDFHRGEAFYVKFAWLTGDERPTRTNPDEGVHAQVRNHPPRRY